MKTFNNADKLKPSQLAVGIALAMGLVSGAQATSITVNTNSMLLTSDGNCGFHEAIEAVNASAPRYGCPGGDGNGDAIYLPAGTYTARVGMSIAKPVNVICTGPGACNVDAGNFTGPMFAINGANSPYLSVQRVNFRQLSGNTNNVTGISAETGRASLEDCSVSGFRMNGLVIVNGTDHSVNRTTFTNNSQDGIFVSPGAAIFVTYSTFTGNTQGAIVTGANGTITSQNNTFSNGGGAGISLSAFSRFTDEGSVIENNNGAGIDGSGDVYLTRTVVRKNRGGGVRLDGSYGELKFCTVDGNTTTGNGGGIMVLTPGALTINSSTVSNNRASGNGGGIYITGGSNMDNVTVSNDTAARGGGIYHNPGGSGGTSYIEMRHGTVAYNHATVSGGGIYPVAGHSPFRTFQCIVAQNSATSNPDVSGFINSYETMYSNVTGFTGVHNDDFYPYNPLLGPLMDNAGPNRVMTRALLKGSPAIDSTTSQSLSEAVDARGLPRLSARWDLGAYEVGPFETELLTIIGQSSDAHEVHTENGLSNRKGTVLRADAVNDYVTYAVAIAEPGTYGISLRVKAGSNRPKVELATSPSTNVYTVIDTTDLYRSSLAYTTKTLKTFKFTSAGTKYFRLKVAGKNASSSGYLCFFDYINIVKQ
jgi:Right handed beta helix region